MNQDILEKLKSKFYQVGWKTILGVVCAAISILAGYFDIIPLEVAVVATALAGVLTTVGVRTALAKVIEALAILIEELRKSKTTAVLLLIFVAGFASKIHAAADTVKYCGPVERPPYEEMGFSALITDASGADSCGDSMYVEFQGRNKIGKKIGVVNYSYTAWQTIYFNAISCPDFPNPAYYPAVDSIIKIRCKDNKWIHIPTISTPLFDEIRAKVTITNGNFRPVSATNTRLYQQIMQRPANKPEDIDYKTNYSIVR